MIRQGTRAAWVVWLLFGLGAVPARAADETLTFDEEMATVIWPRPLGWRRAAPCWRRRKGRWPC